MEDKAFPKDSSLRAQGRHPLVSIEEFCGKIEAAKASSNVLLIARTEALIAGLGQDEAIKRGLAYSNAGADAVLVHSKEKTPEEISKFCHTWPRGVPLVLVPTSYPQISFSEMGNFDRVGLVICGNHAIRAAVSSMQSVFRQIIEEQSIAGVEKRITPVAEIFDLQGDAVMRNIEKDFIR